MTVGTTHLIPNKFYHIYNRANGDQNIFLEESNYIYFLKKYKEYISPIVDTYAYCLIPDRFHFLIRIKPEETIFEFLKQNNKLPEPKMTLEEFELLFKDNDAINLFSLHISKQFSNFFNGYTQALNKKESGKGSLSLHSFKRREVVSSEYLRSLILYIHMNPVHQGFVDKIAGWKYLSYHSIISELETMLKRKEVIELFEDVGNFKFSHEQINHNLMLEIEAKSN